MPPFVPAEFPGYLNASAPEQVSAGGWLLCPEGWRESMLGFCSSRTGDTAEKKGEKIDSKQEDNRNHRVKMRSRYRNIAKIQQNFSTWVYAASEIPQFGNSHLINWILNLFYQHLENWASTASSLLFLLAARTWYCSQPFHTHTCSHWHRAGLQSQWGESQSQSVTLAHFERAGFRSAS